MAKTKPNLKAIKNKAKPSKAAKPVKKEDKKAAKKPVVKAKAIAAPKKAKPAAAAPAKKVDVKKEKEAAKEQLLASKNNAKAKEKASEKAADKTAVKAKPEAKAGKIKAKKVEKKNDDEMEDDLIGDDFGESEIAEYEDDLKAVEDDDDDASLELSDDDDDEDKKDEEVYLTDSEGRRLCKVRDCDQVANVDSYCRYHYLLLWKKIQIRKDILIDGKLEKYVEDLTSRYPDKFLEVIKKDLKTEKDFLSVIQEMDLDENALNENENEDEVQSFADEIRGIGETPSMDDDGDF